MGQGEVQQAQLVPTQLVIGLIKVEGLDILIYYERPETGSINVSLNQRALGQPGGSL